MHAKRVPHNMKTKLTSNGPVSSGIPATSTSKTLYCDGEMGAGAQKHFITGTCCEQDISDMIDTIKRVRDILVC